MYRNALIALDHSSADARLPERLGVAHVGLTHVIRVGYAQGASA
jgi:hypothetical protein